MAKNDSRLKKLLKTAALVEQLETLNLISNELNVALARHKADPSHEAETDTFIRGHNAGYENGLKRAIDTVNYQIGIRQNPPNINYPGERPQ